MSVMNFLTLMSSQSDSCGIHILWDPYSEFHADVKSERHVTFCFYPLQMAALHMQQQAALLHLQQQQQQSSFPPLPPSSNFPPLPPASSSPSLEMGRDGGLAWYSESLKPTGLVSAVWLHAFHPPPILRAEWDKRNTVITFLRVVVGNLWC